MSSLIFYRRRDPRKDESEPWGHPKFITGCRHIPPMGLLYRIKVSFLNPSKELVEARACFNILELPVSAGSEEDFYTTIDKSVLFSMTYFGQE